MCGIVGVIGKEVGKDFIDDSIKSLKHRGPDSDGVWISDEKSVFLGHTRLSIIDLSDSGSQPMIAEDKNGNKFTITFNGEIYNFLDIKKELKTLGYNFESDSDTEVVLKSFIEWGKGCVEKFTGMFAFVVWSELEKKLYLCRDRFGVKPLYYYQTKDNFVFGSELKVIYKYPNFKREIDRNALSLYFQLGFIPAPQTIYKNTYKLESGSWLMVDKDFNIEKEKYWSADKYFDSSYNDSSEEEVLEALEKRLLKSFQYRMVADVDVGIFLSGGIDSSLVVALLQKNTDKKIKTFSIGFEEKDYDEASFARQVADNLGTDHHELYVSSKDVLKNLEKYIEIFDEPFGDSSGLPTFLLSKFAKEHVKVALSGDGGDELFAGYTKYEALSKLTEMSVIKRNLLRILFKILNPQQIVRLSKTLPMRRYSNLREKLAKFSQVLTVDKLSDRFRLAGTYWNKKELNDLLINTEKNNLSDYYKKNKYNNIEQMQLWDINLYLQDDILVKTDRVTMAVGLEGREPFLDESIVELVSKIKPEIKYKDLGSKYLLRKVLYKYLDKDLFNRPKTGFVSPIEKWLKQDLSEKVDYYLDSDKIRKQGIFEPAIVEKIVKDFYSNKYVNPNKVWLLLIFQMWYKNTLK